ncbi:high-affinity Zn(2+) transporter zrt1 [Serendipita sp. 411]|nr:high-affinity Zn(2+) transporter zrt1 [Serendipita sp. 397]KAG8799179.1 high-affinity Zn(2+) transporter zrt1 [Serendipita sp. 398]KAG8839513.1 high-affinity Zn(2+) transporter zrt1 [Serendipita sp. 400]KAG8845621.1 high-affinity Zn(2+) transporter zrt1 [Serendipita sp. 411]
MSEIIEQPAACDPEHLTQDDHRSLRIAAIFIILISSAIGAFFPLFAKRSLRLPRPVYEFAKYFGSGVIIATAFIHLLTPGFEALGSPCLTGAWTVYPWAAAISMSSVFFIFFIELFVFRWGTARLAKSNDLQYDTHGHSYGVEGTHAAHGPEPDELAPSRKSKGDLNMGSPDHDHGHEDHSHQPPHRSQGRGHSHVHSNAKGEHENVAEHALSQAVSILILEFGVIFHSFIIGMTLAVSTEFIPLLVVITFHQFFEGLGLATRLAHLVFPSSSSAREKHLKSERDIETAHSTSPTPTPANQAQPASPLPFMNHFFPWIGAGAYCLTTPLGIAIGLAVQATYSPESATASIVSGVFDSFSSGILLYTGLVELLAHEFLFSRAMREKSTAQVAYAGGCMLLGAALMALLGRWA